MAANTPDPMNRKTEAKHKSEYSLWQASHTPYHFQHQFYLVRKVNRGWKVSTVDAKTRLVINTLKMSSCNININEKQLDYGFENNCNNTPQLYIAYCADG